MAVPPNMPENIQVKTILNKTKRRDPWFLDDYTVNPYSGCSFNCLYCYIRGSRYGEHMEQKLSVKANAVELLDKQLFNRAKKGQFGIIVLSSATDPYLQFEKETELTRQLLGVILKHRFPIHVITKSDLVLRDLDLLQQINEQAILPADLAPVLSQKAIITFSFSTIDDHIAHIFEPGAPPPSTRLETMRTVIQSGFLSGVSLMPLIPYISDTGEHLEKMVATFKEAGAGYIFPAGITLFGNGPSDSKTLVFRAIEKHYPQLVEKYQRLFAQSNGLPAYYSGALSKKMKELCANYDLPQHIAQIKMDPES
ncbi:MAG: radical protein [Bacteroidetes bacterium]|nr:radical protein [Bacteroidota bacterium]